MRRQILSLLVIVCIIPIASLNVNIVQASTDSTTAPDSVNAAGDTVASAITLSLNTQFSNTVANSASKYYNITIINTGSYSINVATLNTNDYEIYVYEPNGVLWDSRTSSTLGSETLPSWFETNPGTNTPLTYTIEIYAYTGSGQFTVNMTDGHSLATANTMLMNYYTYGTTPGPDAYYGTWYNFTVANTSAITFGVYSFYGFDDNFFVYDSVGNLVALGYSGNNPEIYTATLLPGSYSIEIVPFYISNFGNYQFWLYNGNDFYHPLNLTFGGPILSYLSNSRQYYNLSIASAGYYSISLSTFSGNNFGLFLYNSAGNYITSSVNSSNLNIIQSYLSAQTYVVLVYNYTGSGLFYIQVENSFTAGSSVSEAIPVFANTTMEATEPDNQYFNVTVFNPGDYDFNLSSPAGSNFDLYIYSPDGTLIGSSISNSFDDYVVNFPVEQDYTVKIVDYSGSGSYNLSVQQLTPSTGIDAYNAENIAVGSSTMRSFTDYKNYWFNITANTSGSYNFKITSGSSSYSIYIYDSSGNLVSNYANSGTSNLNPGQYSIRIEDVSSAGGSFTLSVTGPPPTTTTPPPTTPITTTPPSSNPVNSQTPNASNGGGNTTPSTTPFGELEIILSTLALIGFSSLYSRRKRK